MGFDIRSLTYTYYLKNKATKFIPSHFINGKILEIGGGLENMSTEADWRDYVALDIDFRNNSYSEKFVQANAMDLPFKTESFDYFIGLNVIEHLEDPEQCLRELYRATRKGGLICVPTLDNFPFIHDPVNWILKYFNKPVVNFGHCGWGHLFNLKKKKWEKIFEDAGFIVEDVVGSGEANLFSALEHFIISIFFSRKEYGEFLHDVDHSFLGSKSLHQFFSIFKRLLHTLYRFLFFLNIQLSGETAYFFVLSKAEP